MTALLTMLPEPAGTAAEAPRPALVPVPDDPWSAWLGGYSPATAAAYRRDATEWSSWCGALGVDPLAAREGHVTAWVGALRCAGRSPATVARKVATLSSLYGWARRNGLTTADPIPPRRPAVHRDDSDRLGLSRDQARGVLDAAAGYSPRAHALVALLCYCGLRVSEALAADVADVAETRGHRVLRVLGKGGRPRTVPLPPAAWSALSAYLAGRDAGPLLATGSCARLDRHAAHDCVRRVGRRAGLHGLHPHQLRHTAATLALDAGAPLDRVQSLLGHADPRTTMRYARARDRLDTSAAYDLARWLGGAE